MELKDLFQNADWKSEKHVPFIEAPERVNKSEPLTVKVIIGKEIPHPNTAAHHIMWINLYFKPEGDKFPYQIGHTDFSAHGESVAGPDTSTVYTLSEAYFVFKTDKPGVIMASGYCNIHGLWENQQILSVS